MDGSSLVQQSITFLIIAFVICVLLSCFCKPWKRSTTRTWIVAAIFTIGGVASLIQIIKIGSSTVNLATQRGIVIDSPSQTQAILAKKMDVSAKCVIPTGVQVQGFKFETSLDLEMHGYIWQTYPANCPEKLRGFTVPEASDGGFERREIRRTKNADGSESVLFQFETTQRQLFYYEHFPFDYQTLWLRLWSLDFDGSAVLVPDFASYPKWEETKKLGIDPDAEIGGFALDFTRWSIFFPETQTSFGLKAFDGPPQRVGLYYNVGFHRLLVGPFVNHIVPIIAIIFLTFAALMFVHTDQDRATTVLTFLGALLFAAIINDQGIRATVIAAGYTVVGLYSIVSYVLLILVSVNVVVIAKSNIQWLEYDDNIISKAIFLPIATWAMALVTHFSLIVN
jgi:hypothetical protein